MATLRGTILSALDAGFLVFWVVRVGGDDGELRPWHCIYVYRAVHIGIQHHRPLCVGEDRVMDEPFPPGAGVRNVSWMGPPQGKRAHPGPGPHSVGV